MIKIEIRSQKLPGYVSTWGFVYPHTTKAYRKQYAEDLVSRRDDVGPFFAVEIEGEKVLDKYNLGV